MDEKKMNEAVRQVLKRLQYPIEVMLVCVRWYAAYPLSLRQIEEMMAERGVVVDHATIHRWSIKMLPVLAAVLATLRYHALRREELCKLTIKDFRHERRGVAHLKVSGKGSKTRYVPLHPAAHGLIVDYLEADGRGLEAAGALFRAVGNRAGGMARAITADAI